MPIVVALLGLFGITVAVIGGENLANTISPPPPVNQNQQQVPQIVWIGLTIVGAVLLYKEGAKILKL